MLGMTKIKMSSEEAGSIEFVERRRAALERSYNIYHCLLSAGIVATAGIFATPSMVRCVKTHSLNSLFWSSRRPPFAIW